MGRTTRHLCISLICIALSACSFYGPRDEVNKFASDKDDLIAQISRKVEADPTVAGVAEAQKLVDTKRDSLMAQRKAIDEANPGKNSDWRSTLAASQSRDGEMLLAIAVKLGTDCKVSCDEVRAKFDALKESFRKATHLPGEI